MTTTAHRPLALVLAAFVASLLWQSTLAVPAADAVPAAPVHVALA